MKVLVRRGLVLGLGLGLAGCSTTSGGGGTTQPVVPAPPSSPRRDLGRPRDFFLHLHDLARANDVKKWGAQLSRRRRARGPNYVRGHLRAWGRDISGFFRKYLGGDATRLRARLLQGRRHLRLEAWSADKPKIKLKMTVAREGGRLVIDEN